MINIAVVGAAGRMGGAIVRSADQDQAVQVTAALERPGAEALGKDAGELAAVGANGVAVVDSLDDAEFDVLIDFSTPAATLKHIVVCERMNKAIVIGTTGMSEENIAMLKAAARNIPILFAANMSVGVNITLKLLQMAAQSLGNDTDIEIIEAHHKHKVDAPSGTALKMGEVVAAAVGKDLQQDGVFSRHGIIGARPEGSIGFSTIRGGSIAGEHTVMFIGESERIEITHRATDRGLFADGAIRAAKWLAGQPAGLYDMPDVLGIA